MFNEIKCRNILFKYKTGGEYMKKKKKHKNDIYIGRYGSHPYILAYNKKVIRNYFEYHRYLGPNDYSIDYAEEYEVDMYYELMATKYHGIYLPYRDILIGQILYSGTLKEYLETTASNLVNFARILGQMKKTKKDVAKIMDIISLISEYVQDPETLDSLNEYYELSNPICYMTMERLLQDICKCEEMENYKYFTFR